MDFTFSIRFSLNTKFQTDSKLSVIFLLTLAKFVEFIKSLGRCLHFEIMDTIGDIVESQFSKIDQFSSEIKQNLQKTVTKPASLSKTQQELASQTKSQSGNKNIEALKKVPKDEENLTRIYKICKRIATENDKEAMSFAVREKFVYVTEKLDYGESIYTKAAEDGNLDLIRLLIESGIDINCRDNDNSTALINASIYGRLEVVKLLLTVPGIDVNAKDKDNNTALIRASLNGHYEIVKLLLTFPGIDVNAKDKDNNTALIRASLNGHYEIVKLLLTFPGIDVNVKTSGNSTALIYASTKGYHEIVELLKDHGAT